MVSLVDKEAIKIEQNVIGEKLRSWLKSQLAARVESAMALTDTLAAAAAEQNKVSVSTLLTYHPC
jgi:hypothetical protein